MSKLPNILTISRIILTPVFLILILSENEYMRILALVVFTIAALTDFFDGYLARQLDADSDFGNFLDPLADKILTFSGFLAFSLLDPHVFPWWILALIIGRDVFITLLRMIAKRNNKVLQTSNSAKLKTAVQMVFIYIGLVAFIALSFKSLNEITSAWLFESGALYFLYLGVMLFTVYTALEYVVKNKDIFSRA